MAKSSRSTSAFFSPASVATLAGAALIVVIVTNVVDSVFGFTPQWLPLLIALVVSITAYQVALRERDEGMAQTPRFARYVLVVLNAFLIYASAFGMVGTTLSEEAVSGGQQSTASSNGTVVGWYPLFSLEKRVVAPDGTLPTPGGNR